MDAETLLTLRSYLSVAHHIPGRIRVKLNPGLLSDPKALALAGSVDLGSWGNGSGASAILKTRLNLKAGSLIVDYDPHLVKPELIGELFSSSDPGRVEQLVEQLADLLGLKIKS